MSGLRYAKPKFVREVDTELSKLVGKRFAREATVFDSNLDREIVVTRVPSNYCENIMRAVLQDTRPKTLKTTEVEPNGGRSFPDLRVKFKNSFSYDFEVKSWTSVSHTWNVAKIKAFRECLQAKDPLYLNTWYVDFDLTPRNDAFEISHLRTGRIWDFCSAEGLTDRGTAFRSNKRSTPEEFLWNASGKDQALYGNGVEMLRDLNVRVEHN